jgi:hypothetical protein
MTASLQSQPSRNLSVKKSVVRQIGFWLAAISWYAVVIAAQSFLRSTDIARLSLFYVCFAVPIAIPLLSGIAMALLIRGRHTEAAWGIGAAYGSNLILALASMLIPSVNGLTGSVVMLVMSVLGWPMWLMVWLGGA